MQFTLGFIKSENQAILRTFDTLSPLEISSKILDVNSLEHEDISGLYFSKSLFNQHFSSEEIQNLFENEIRHYPIRSFEDFNLTPDIFTSMGAPEAQNYFEKMRTPWLLKKNLDFLEELFKVLNHLEPLWKNERATFFEELWFILKNNLGTSELTIIFNNLKTVKTQNEKASEKNILVKTKITGKKYGNLQELETIDETLISHYEKEFSTSLNILDMEINSEKGELVIPLLLQGGQILIMAKCPAPTRLQKSILKALFDGLGSYI